MFNDKNYYLFEEQRLSSFTSWKFAEDLPCNKFAVRKSLNFIVMEILNDAIVVVNKI